MFCLQACIYLKQNRHQRLHTKRNQLSIKYQTDLRRIVQSPCGKHALCLRRHKPTQLQNTKIVASFNCALVNETQGKIQRQRWLVTKYQRATAAQLREKHP